MSNTARNCLFTKHLWGDIELPNRIVMAPMTRCRALAGAVPNPMAATYYAQRASAGLIISEGSQVSPMGVGFMGTPGLHSEEQTEGWKPIVEAVHRAGGRIFAQLWHVGRVSHPDLLGGQVPIGPSAIASEGEVHTPNGKQAPVTPRALEIDEIPGVVEEFERAARNAKTAGFDGVEIHGANGYLLDQFLRDSANQRADRYGGSPQNRARFPLEVTEAVVGVWGPERVGYKCIPTVCFGGMADSNPRQTYEYFATELDHLKIGYLHIFEPVGGMFLPAVVGDRLAPMLREIFHGTVILNGGYTADSGAQAIESGAADLIAFGAPYVSNPDLVERFRRDAPLTPPDVSTFYVGGEKGYTDYPTLG